MVASGMVAYLQREKLHLRSTTKMNPHSSSVQPSKILQCGQNPSNSNACKKLFRITFSFGSFLEKSWTAAERKTIVSEHSPTNHFGVLNGAHPLWVSSSSLDMFNFHCRCLPSMGSFFSWASFCPQDGLGFFIACMMSKTGPIVLTADWASTMWNILFIEWSERSRESVKPHTIKHSQSRIWNIC